LRVKSERSFRFHAWTSSANFVFLSCRFRARLEDENVAAGSN